MFAGRQLRIRQGSTVLAGARAEALSITRDFVDITEKDATGIRTLLAQPVGFAVDVLVEGVLRNSVLLDHARNPLTQSFLELSIDIATLGTFAGFWAMSDFETSGAEGAEPIAFRASFQSSGTVSFTTP